MTPSCKTTFVLVTGANGYIAVWVVKTFLDQGFTVRGTVRSESKATHLRSLFKHFGDKFEVVIVEDITKEGAFDEAVKGIDAIAHTSSPFHFKADDPNELIGPAVHGTTGILASVLKNAPTVKRIVVTSSCAAIRMVTPLNEPRLFTEADWNEASIAEVNEKGRAATNFGKYRASKTLAERAAWEFWNKHKGEVQWDLAVVNPPYVFGPFLHEVDKPEYLNESMRDWYETVVKGVRDDDSLVNVGSSYVDVRDLAQCHVLAVTKQEAGGERIIINAGLWKWQDFVNIAHRLCPSLPAGNTSYDPATVVHLTSYSPDKERMLLGINFRTIEETTKDTLDDFKARGWL